MFYKWDARKRPGQSLGATWKMWTDCLLSALPGLGCYQPPPSKVPGVSLQTKLSLSLVPRLQPLLQYSPYPTSLTDWCGIKKTLPLCFSSDQPWVAILASELRIRLRHQLEMYFNCSTSSSAQHGGPWLLTANVSQHTLQIMPALKSLPHSALQVMQPQTTLRLWLIVYILRTIL